MKHYQILVVGPNKWAVGINLSTALMYYESIHGERSVDTINHVLIFEAKSKFKKSGPCVYLDDIGRMQQVDCILIKRFDRLDNETFKDFRKKIKEPTEA